MNANQQEDQLLLQRISNGEEAAFQTLFEKYYRYLSIAAYKVCADQHKAKDIAQEVFLDLWKKRKELNVHTSLNAFLKKAALFKSIDYLRSQRLDFAENMVDSPAYEAKGIQKKLELEELKSLIHRTAEQLPERCRIIFFMSRFEHKSHKEIAEILEISPKTVEHQIGKALKILRHTIQPYLSDNEMV